jgi:hypothetical protein
MCGSTPSRQEILFDLFFGGKNIDVFFLKWHNSSPSCLAIDYSFFTVKKLDVCIMVRKKGRAFIFLLPQEFISHV